MGKLLCVWAGLPSLSWRCARNENASLEGLAWGGDELDQVAEAMAERALCTAKWTLLLPLVNSGC